MADSSDEIESVSIVQETTQNISEASYADSVIHNLHEELKCPTKISNRDNLLRKDECMILWRDVRPHMSIDFSDKMHPIKRTSICENIEDQIITDLLSCLGGFQGELITARKLQNIHDVRKFDISDDIPPTYKILVERMLPIASNYSMVARFIEGNHLMTVGRVNQALSAALENIITGDYMDFVDELWDLHDRQKSLDLNQLMYQLQKPSDLMAFLADLVNEVNQQESRGGKTLDIVYKKGKPLLVAEKEKLLIAILETSSVPYFESLKKWLCYGDIYDPLDDFMIVERRPTHKTDTFSKGYWDNRYAINEAMVPGFLQNLKQKIFRTGKYLNAIEECEKLSGKKLFNHAAVGSFKFDDDIAAPYITSIEEAYNRSSLGLLAILMKEYDLLNRFRSIKRYFMIESDFIIHLLSLCEEELSKRSDDVIPMRVQLLIEGALQQCSTAQSDPYKEAITVDFLTYDFTFLACRAFSTNPHEGSDYWSENEHAMVGIDFFTLNTKLSWPFCLFFDETMVGTYQLIFRLLLKYKHVEWKLTRCWWEQPFKYLSKKDYKRLSNIYFLRYKMLFFVQNLGHYMLEDVIEVQWKRFSHNLTRNLVESFRVKIMPVKILMEGKDAHTFPDSVRTIRLHLVCMHVQVYCYDDTAKNVDDAMNHHAEYLRECLSECMITTIPLTMQITSLFRLCHEYCDSIKNLLEDGEDCIPLILEKVKECDASFDSGLAAFLKNVAVNGRLQCGTQINNFLARQNHNDYYSSVLENSDSS